MHECLVSQTYARNEINKVECNFVMRLGMFIGEIHFHLCGFVGTGDFNNATQLAIVC